MTMFYLQSDLNARTQPCNGPDMDWSRRNADENYWPREENLEAPAGRCLFLSLIQVLPRNVRVSKGSCVSSQAVYCR